MKLDEIDKAILAHFSPGFGGTEIPQWLFPWLENGLGGITLFSSNCPSLESTAQLVDEIKAIAPNIIISIDEEGGDVTRLFVPEGSPFPTPALLGRCNNSELTQNSYFELGKILRAVGVDLNLAPVADVSVEIENPIVGVRSFSSDFETASTHVVSAISGLRKAGVASCIKHFPGHGGVVEDSHHDLPKLLGNLDELESTHLKPFKDAIAAGVEAVMTGHIVVPALDEKAPASCSSKLTKDYLRETLKFKGLVVTDALDMGALGGPKKIHQSALRAMSAGADLLCFSGLFDQSTFVENSLLNIKDFVINYLFGWKRFSFVVFPVFNKGLLFVSRLESGNKSQILLHCDEISIVGRIGQHFQHPGNQLIRCHDAPTPFGVLVSIGSCFLFRSIDKRSG